MLSLASLVGVCPAHLTPAAAQTQKARKLYEKYDTDGSNDIDKSELSNILKDLNLRLTTEMFDKFVWSYWNATDVDVRCVSRAWRLGPLPW